MMNGVGLNNVRNTPAMQSGRNLTSSIQVVNTGYKCLKVAE